MTTLLEVLDGKLDEHIERNKTVRGGARFGSPKDEELFSLGEAETVLIIMSLYTLVVDSVV